MDYTDFFINLDRVNSAKVKESYVLKTDPGLHSRVSLFCDIVDLYDISFSQKLWHYFHGAKAKPKCTCGKDTTWRSFSVGYLKFCSPKCMANDASVKKSISESLDGRSDEIKNKREQTNLSKYGHKSHLSSDVIRNKIKATNKEKYGHDNVFGSDDIRNKIDKTNMIKYGSTRPLDNLDVQDRMKASNTAKYGNEHHIASDQVRSKIVETNIGRYGVENAGASMDVIKKRITTSHMKLVDKLKNDGFDVAVNMDRSMSAHCSKCDAWYNTTYSMFAQRVYKYKVDPCIVCNPPNVSDSGMQIELLSFVESLGLFAISNYTIPNSRLEIDVFVPELNIGFEMNGIYWHSTEYKDKDYHVNKASVASESGISLVFIWDDDWQGKKDIIKSRIMNMVGMRERNIYARDCKAFMVGKDEAVRFENDNHLQGNGRASIYIGLYHSGVLVSLMSFGSLRKFMGSMDGHGKYELIRFCNALGTSVVGGASKIFKYFVRIYDPEYVLSYADRCWTTKADGSLYDRLGFSYSGTTAINYWYVINNRRVHRYVYNKARLVSEGGDPSKTATELLSDRGIYSVYGCGNFKYEWNKGTN